MIHVLFDIDATLLHIKKGIDRESSAVMFKKVFGFDAHEEMTANVGKTEWLIIKEVIESVRGVSFTEPIPNEAYTVWAEEDAKALTESTVQVLPGVIDLLTALSKKEHIRVALLSGNSSYRSKVKIRAAGLDQFFTDTDGTLRGVFGDMSPQRSELVAIVKKQSTAGEKFVIVDDSLIGAKMAKEHGLPLIAVATGHVSAEELKAYTPYVFSDFGDERWKEVIAIIDQLS